MWSVTSLVEAKKMEKCRSIRAKRKRKSGSVMTHKLSVEAKKMYGEWWVDRGSPIEIKRKGKRRLVKGH